MNLADSERMAGTLESAGYTCAADASDADVIVYNTCSIRDKVRHSAAICYVSPPSSTMQKKRQASLMLRYDRFT